jgi:sulfonate transport system permease protein
VTEPTADVRHGGLGAAESVFIDAAIRQPKVSGPPLTSRRSARLITAVALPLGILLAWQLTTMLGWFSVVQVPPPAMVAQAAVDLFERGLLVKYVAISVQRVLLGFAIGASLGLALGALTGLSSTWDRFFGSTLAAIRAVPSLAWVPLLIIWLKIGEESKVTLIAIGAFFPVFTTVSLALRHVDKHLVEAGRAFGLSGVRLLTQIQLPAILPSVISGLRLALAQAWLFVVAAELIAANQGLGFLLTDSANTGRVDRIFLAIILLAIIGKTTDSILGVFERRAIRRWA